MEKTIYIKAAKAGYKLPVGCSQWWGNPDLPKNKEYPTFIDAKGKEREYDFICQINLEEVALKNPSTQLPHRGLLSFFAKIGHYLGKDTDEVFVKNNISGIEEVKVFYFDDPSLLEEVVLMNKEGKDASAQEMRMVLSLDKEPYDEENGLFMPPSHRKWATWTPPFETWKILFQVDSFMGNDFSLNFMNRGVLDFLISPKDLEMQCFDNIRGIILSE